MPRNNIHYDQELEYKHRSLRKALERIKPPYTPQDLQEVQQAVLSDLERNKSKDNKVR